MNFILASLICALLAIAGGWVISKYDLWGGEDE